MEKKQTNFNAIFLIEFAIIAIVSAAYLLYLGSKLTVFTRINSLISIVISVFVILYVSKGSTKRVAYAYKSMTILFAITCFISCIGSISMDFPASLVGICLDMTCFILMCVVAFVKDLGEKKAMICCKSVIVIQALMLVMSLFFVSGAIFKDGTSQGLINLIRTLTGIFHSLIILEATSSKYLDKKARGTK